MNLTKLRLKEIIKNELRLLLNEQEMPRRFAGMSTAYLAKRGYQWINGSMVHKTKGDARDVVAIYKARRSGQKAPARKYGAPGSHFTPAAAGPAAATTPVATAKPGPGAKSENTYERHQKCINHCDQQFPAPKGAGPQSARAIADKRSKTRCMNACKKALQKYIKGQSQRKGGTATQAQPPQTAKPDELVGISKGGKPLYKKEEQARKEKAWIDRRVAMYDKKYKDRCRKSRGECRKMHSSIEACANKCTDPRWKKVAQIFVDQVLHPDSAPNYSK